MTKNMIYEFKHVGLVVKNLDKQLKFYRDVLGLVVVKSASEDSKYIGTVLALGKANLKTVKMSAKVGSSGGLLELLYFPEKKHSGKHFAVKPNTPGFTHIALTVISIEGVYKRLSKLGISFLSSPTNSPDGYARIVFCKDPEGNIIELVEILNK
jgi:catechol 2,3-dioxygenase-like lactoylglutathione lyase family enzyme